MTTNCQLHQLLQAPAKSAFNYHSSNKDDGSLNEDTFRRR